MAVTLRRHSARLLVGSGLAAIVTALGMLGAAWPVEAHSSAPSGIADVRFDQRVGSSIPADLVFHDELGRAVSLGSYLGAAPVVLTMNQLTCPNLCPLEIEGLATAMKGGGLALGRDVSVVTVSIDPREGPDSAAVVRDRALRA